MGGKRLSNITCPVCGVVFKPKNYKSKFCSKQCQYRAKKLPILVGKITTKKCNKCKIEKNISEFAKASTRTGLHQSCKLCFNKRRKSVNVNGFCVDCGNPIIRKIPPGHNLHTSWICNKCSMHRIMEKNGGHTINYTGTDFYSGGEFAQWKLSAKRRGHIWELTKEDLNNQYKKQNGLCALSGLPMSTDKKSPYRLSLDRIDSKIGYIVTNIQFVCSMVNVMKNKFVQKDFIDVCRHITKYSYKDYE